MVFQLFVLDFFFASYIGTIEYQKFKCSSCHLVYSWLVVGATFQSAFLPVTISAYSAYDMLTILALLRVDGNGVDADHALYVFNILVGVDEQISQLHLDIFGLWKFGPEFWRRSSCQMLMTHLLYLEVVYKWVGLWESGLYEVSYWPMDRMSKRELIVVALFHYWFLLDVLNLIDCVI